jgi:hypothetical protein
MRAAFHSKLSLRHAMHVHSPRFGAPVLTRLGPLIYPRETRNSVYELGARVVMIVA